MKRFFLPLLSGLMITSNLFGQNPQSDSIIHSLQKNYSSDKADQGLQLIETGNFTGANTYFSKEIGKDESDRAAYFKRGVANWALSDTLNACRDWSAVLALGDTEMFNLLESKCHGAMIIENDTIPSKQYRKMWSPATQDKSGKTVVSEMPVFPGGESGLFSYLKNNVQTPVEGNRGVVYVSFLIDPKGKIVYPYVLRTFDKRYNKEAIRLVRNMPKWIPGKENGKAVYVRSSLPIRF